MGQVAEALECHERVLALDPDSMIDKIKVNDLRNLLVARSSIAATPDRRMAIVGAVAAFVLVASIGIVIAKSGGSSDAVAMNKPVTNPIADSNVSRFTAPVVPPGAATQKDPAATNAPVNNQGNTQPPQSATAAEREPVSNVSLPPASADNRLPHVNGPIGGNDAVGAVKLEISPDVKKQLENQQAKDAAATTQRPPSGETGDPDPEAVPPQKQQAPGIMEITVVSRDGKPTGDSQNNSGMHVNGVEALLRTARNQYQVGEYASAAIAYERALRAGADPASSNQRLAQCYEKLGRNSDAVAAYGRAVDAFQADLNAGRGDKARLSSAIDSCKQAIKVLGG
jgi:tetratricopeptide (TPR) repeat protein